MGNCYLHQLPPPKHTGSSNLRACSQPRRLGAVDQREAHKNTSRAFQVGEVLAAIAWGGCVFLTEGLCLPLVGVFSGLVGISLNKDNDVAVQQATIEGYRREIEGYQSDLQGLFIIGQAIHGQP